MLGPDKHTWIAENLLKSDATPAKKKLQDLVYSTTTKKTRLTLCMIASWGVYFPPYNLARLAGVTRSAGYSTTVFDFNGQLYHDLKAVNLDTAWDSVAYWWWLNDNYWERLHPQLEPYLRDHIRKIVESKPDVVGFSLYETNMVPTNWVIKELRKQLPNIKIILGGPQCHNPNFIPESGVDHWVSGEGEQILLDFLANYENGISDMPVKLGETYGEVRLELDTLPMPDYTDYDFSIYKMTNGVSAELSRGCVAQCSFCRETWFWKYRDRQSHTLLDEVEFQVKNYGIKTVWFIDSLVNGNLKELRGFALGVLERKLDIEWMGYARCDGRMDYDYFVDLHNSGCAHLSFGVESGSQKVLDLMNKKIDLQSISSNLRDCHKANILVLVNWIVGFPNEDIQAASDSLNLIWNNRNNIHVMSPGMTFGDDVLSDFGFNRHRNDVCPIGKFFEGWWWKLDWSSTKINRLIRLKLLNIWITLCQQHAVFNDRGVIINSQERASLKDHYTISFLHEEFDDQISNENFNYNIIDTTIGPFANGVVNEMWGFVRSLWRLKGGFTFEITANKDSDLAEFGSILTGNDHSYTFKFTVDDAGVFSAETYHKYQHLGEPWMVGTKSFEFAWQGQGSWTKESTHAILTASNITTAWADDCEEEVSTDTRQQNMVDLQKNYKERKYIPISLG